MRSLTAASLIASLAPLVALVACASTAARAPQNVVVAPLALKANESKHDEEPSPGFRLPADTRPLAYALHFDLDPEKTSFSGRAIIKVHLDQARRSIFLHARKLTVQTATVNGLAARFAQLTDDGQARLSLDAPIGPGDVEIELAWTARYNDALESVYRVQSEGRWYVFTQFEAISARDSFPCFDEPGFKAPVTLSFTTRTEDIVVANTMPVATAPDGEGRVRTTFQETQALPVYLLAWAVGPLDIVEGKPLPPSGERREPVAIRGITARGHGKDLGVSLDLTLRSLASLERYFGVPYPYGKLDIVAVPDFAAGAMENAGLVTFRDNLLFVDDTSPIGMQKSNIHVIAHELAHQWFGNLVTLAWWDDLWLNEAFASWAQTFVVEELRKDLSATTDARSSADWVMGEDSLVSARQIRQPVLAKGDIINAFDGITYSKGASVIAMFEEYVGSEAFQRGVRAYLQAHAHGTATADDLFDALGAAAGKDVKTPFSTFINKPGVPYLQTRLVCTKDSARLELTQERYLPVGSTGERAQLWHIPVCVRSDASAAASCMLLSERSGALALGARCPKLVHPNADGLGYYRWSLPGDQLQRVGSSLRTLSAGERISFANAVRASAWAASLSFADALAASLPLARDLEPDVANTPYGLLNFAWSELVEPAARPLVLHKLAASYRPVLDDVQLMPRTSDDPRARERRTLALSALSLAEDQQVARALEQLGRAALGIDGAHRRTGAENDGRVHLDTIPADLAAAAIAAAIRGGGEPVWSHAAALLSTESDSLARSYLLSGLGGVEDLALGKRALELSLDARLKVNEVLSPLWGQVGDPRTREQAYAWSRANIDALLARLPGEAGGEIVPVITGGGCSEAAALELDAFVTPRKAKLPGVERALAQALESIRLCAAKKAAHVDSARELFPVPPKR